MYQIQLIWNREFDWVNHGNPLHNLVDAISSTQSLLNMGDGASVKKAKVINTTTGEVVWK